MEYNYNLIFIVELLVCDLSRKHFSWFPNL